MSARRSVLVCGAGGFVGTHLVSRLAREGCEVRGVDLRRSAFSESEAHEFVLGDLRDRGFFRSVVDRPFDEVYQLAADMGGAGYIFSDENDADVMRNSAAVNLNALDACLRAGAMRVFFPSSACVYPLRNQTDPSEFHCAEASAYPADPDSEYD
ncbi:GDP-L-fucose synthase [Methylobacterium adhaesivum]|nr:GDP-L-fucose synthase [Methylobacterium adhaesivum]